MSGSTASSAGRMAVGNGPLPDPATAMACFTGQRRTESAAAALADMRTSGQMARSPMASWSAIAVTTPRAFDLTTCSSEPLQTTH